MAFTYGSIWVNGSTQGNATNMNKDLCGFGLYSEFPAPTTGSGGNAGMIAHATDRNLLYRSDGTNWVCIGIAMPSGGASGDIIYFDGTAAQRLPKGSDGQVLKLNSGLPSWSSPSLMPSGSIIMWSGTIASIPSGWVICDGNNGTPNLLGRFIEGVATAGTNPGAIGGATSKTTAGHIHSQPTHTHGPGGDHFGTLTSNNGSPGWQDYNGNFNASTAAGGGANTGSQTDSISDIRPPYYDLAFIMKT
jgi:hypothetical protein